MTDTTGAGEVIGLDQSIAYAEGLAAEAGEHGTDGGETYLAHLAERRVVGDGITTAADMQQAFTTAAAAAAAHAAELTKQKQLQEAYDATPDAGDKDFQLGADTGTGPATPASTSASTANSTKGTPVNDNAEHGDVTGQAPPPGKLVDDNPGWWYLGHGITSATRRIRTYEMPDGRLVAVVTESGDGTSITNAAETVVAQVRAEHPGRQVDVIEHNPASTIAGESFDLIGLSPSGNATWTRLPAQKVADMLGPEVFVNGTSLAPRTTSNHDHDRWYLEAQGGAIDGKRIPLNP